MMFKIFKFFSPIIKVAYAHHQIQKTQKSGKEESYPLEISVNILLFFVLISSLCTLSKMVVHSSCTILNPASFHTTRASVFSCVIKNPEWLWFFACNSLSAVLWFTAPRLQHWALGCSGKRSMLHASEREDANLGRENTLLLYINYKPRTNGRKGRIFYSPWWFVFTPLFFSYTKHLFICYEPLTFILLWITGSICL